MSDTVFQSPGYISSGHYAMGKGLNVKSKKYSNVRYKISSTWCQFNSSSNCVYSPRTSFCGNHDTNLVFGPRFLGGSPGNLHRTRCGSLARAPAIISFISLFMTSTTVPKEKMTTPCLPDSSKKSSSSWIYQVVKGNCLTFISCDLRS